MIGHLDPATVDWARAQFALTALYHWIFVPLTLGLSWFIAYCHTLYYRTGNEEWKRLTRFWMRLFAVNFAVGVATGIILEFEFGTNWSNYSWMVGDIFGAPLAIEGLFAFFLESTFFAVMFFGWDRVSRRFHLVSTWMVALGSNLSAVWILVANAWMQHPVGQQFNPGTARFEMSSFKDVVFSPVAVAKFTHTTTSSMVLSGLFVISVSSWYLLKGRHKVMARRSIILGSVFCLLSSLFVIFTGDQSAYAVAQKQPMKLAACEGLLRGQTGAELIAIGVVKNDNDIADDQQVTRLTLGIPELLSYLANRNFQSFVPGIHDMVYGNPEQNLLGAEQKMVRGRAALAALAAYKADRKAGDETGAAAALDTLKANQEFIGYGYLEKPEDAVPPIALSFYSFHVMVILGATFPVVALLFLIVAWRNSFERRRWLLRLGTIMVFPGMIAHWLGWIVAEVGRQPWAIQDLLPVNVAATRLSSGSVKTTFFLFLVLFTVLLIAEVGIMLKQIAIGPEEG